MSSARNSNRDDDKDASTNREGLDKFLSGELGNQNPEDSFFKDIISPRTKVPNTDLLTPQSFQYDTPSPSRQTTNRADEDAKLAFIIPFCVFEPDQTGSYSDSIGNLTERSGQLVKLSWQPALAEGELLEKSKGRIGSLDNDGQMVHQYVNREMQLLSPTDRKRALRTIHSKGPPLAVERQQSLINTKDYSLLDCKSTLELFKCIKHTMTGWLIQFLNGSLHRDISIGNVLKTEKADGEDVLQFSYPESFENDLKELAKRNATRSGEDAKLWEDMQKAKNEVEKLLKAEFSPSSSCSAFVADIEEGIPTDLLCESDERMWEKPSGTVQFMSRQVLWSIELGSNDFLQSPADDLDSFFYVALWAIFFNKHTSTKLSVKETILKSKLLVMVKRTDGMLGYLEAPPCDLTSPLTKEAQPVMEEWNNKQSKFYKQIRERAMIDVAFAKDAADSLWRRSVGWILCALSGVMMIETIINSHLEDLKKYPDFASRIQ